MKYCFATGRPRERTAGPEPLVRWASAPCLRALLVETLGSAIWATKVEARGGARRSHRLAHLRSIGVSRVYISNDIDATDPAAAPSTGAPAPGGLSAGFVRALIARIGDAFPLLGGDIVEVAPTIGSPADAKRTTDLAACYMLETLASMVGASGAKWRTTTLDP